MKVALLVLCALFLSTNARRTALAETQDCDCAIEDGPGRSNIFVCATPEKLTTHYREGGSLARDLRATYLRQRIGRNVIVSLREAILERKIKLAYRHNLKFVEAMAERVKNIRLRRKSSQLKRQDASPCDCLDQYSQCLNDRTCVTDSLRGLCNWSNGRLFGHCAACSGLVQEQGQFQTRSSIISKLEYYKAAIEQYVHVHIAEIEDVDISYDWTSDKVLLSLAIFETVEEKIKVVDNFLGSMSKLFDVFMDTFVIEVESPSQKRALKAKTVYYYSEAEVLVEESVVERLLGEIEARSKVTMVIESEAAATETSVDESSSNTVVASLVASLVALAFLF